MKLVSTAISTTQFSGAYLKRAWQERHTLSEYERNGFSVYFYMTISGHVEACMMELMEYRLIHSRSVIYELRKLTKGANGAGLEHPENANSVFDTFEFLINSRAGKLAKTTKEGLTEAWQDIFGRSLKDTLGAQLHLDLNALFDLRNIFAHGRELWLKFTQDEKNLLSLDRNPLQQAAQRLYAAGVLPTLQVEARSHADFQRTFFSDTAMLYFLQKAREVEAAIKAPPFNNDSIGFPLTVTLPELTPTD